MEEAKLLHLIEKTERLTRKMDLELAKSKEEWDRINKIIVESAKLEIRTW